jgi:hypothetical protein
MGRTHSETDMIYFPVVSKPNRWNLTRGSFREISHRPTVIEIGAMRVGGGPGGSCTRIGHLQLSKSSRSRAYSQIDYDFVLRLDNSNSSSGAGRIACLCRLIMVPYLDSSNSNLQRLSQRARTESIRKARVANGVWPARRTSTGYLKDLLAMSNTRSTPKYSEVLRTPFSLGHVMLNWKT